MAGTTESTGAEAEARLPELAAAELDELFAGDALALRRYAILRSVLALGRTQREAAAAHAVSERTVRNTLRLYAGARRLDALRTRPARPRRDDRRRQSYGQALAAALAEEPAAGGDRLWRRARELLGEGGSGLSRRTAYRLLAELRGAEPRADTDLADAVRAALALLSEDPPLALGASALARRLLGDEGDSLQRGTLLQQALRAALDRLRPPEQVDAVDRSWWPYLICTGEYEAGQPRAELQQALALSPSTYTRAKRQGLMRITALAPTLVAQLTDAPAALASRRLPRAHGFVGRREEQSYYAWRLQTEGRAVIWGLPGAGKTALAAELAADGQRYGQTVIWHTCRPGRAATLAGMLREIAEALASAGAPELWQELRRPPGERPPDEDLVDTLGALLLAHPSVVVIDDAHRAEEDAAPLLEVLERMAARGHVRLLLISRRGPAEGGWPALAGLSEREARLLFAAAATMPAEQWGAIYARTAGLPRPLLLAGAAWRTAAPRHRARAWEEAVDAWAQESIWGALGRAERRVLAAACAGAPLADLADSDGALAAAAADLQRRDLLGPDGERPAVAGALRRGAEEVLRADPPLREALAAAPDPEPDPEPAAPQRQPEIPAHELLSRLHDALERSREYLEARPHDRAAAQIASELASLRAALPRPQPV